MGLFKTACGLFALSYLVAAIFPSSSLLYGIKYSGPEIVPEWAGRTIFVGYALLFGIIWYGVRKRISIYWILSPILLAIYLLTEFGGALWSFVRLALPWAPLILVIVLVLAGYLAFLAWWRNQKNYFG